METYELVRRSVLVSGMSKREAAREFGLNRRTISKMVEHPAPPGYRLGSSRTRWRIGPYQTRIEEIVREDEFAPRKQRHTAKRIFERLRDEFGYEGGPTQVRAYVAQLKSRSHEAFVPLVSVPGEAEADFGEAWADIGGVRRKCHAFVMVLPLSGVWFMRVYPAENSESFCDGNAAAFRFFGGVPNRIVYDNPAYAVLRGTGPLKGRDRVLCRDFAELRSACLFEAAFAAARSGNEKGSVERKVCTLRQSLLVPVPVAASFDELNARVLEKAAQHQARCERFQEERLALLPPADYTSSRLTTGRVDKYSLVRFDGSSYSVPTRFALKSLLVRATPFTVEVLSAKEVVATHPRSLDKGRIVADYAHYLDLLERKPRAVKAALPVLQAGFPHAFEAYRRRVEDGTGAGDRRFVGVLRIAHELGVERVERALCLAMSAGLREPADIRLLVLREKEALPLPLCTDWKLPNDRKSPTVERPPISEYTRLLARSGS